MFKNFEKRLHNDGYCEKINNNSDNENVMNYIDEFIVKVWKKHKSINLFNVTMHIHNFLYNDVIKMMYTKDISSLDDLKVYEMTKLIGELKHRLGCYNEEYDKMFFDFFILISHYGKYQLQNLYEKEYEYLVTMIENTDVKTNLNDEF